jgi:hypothetical protein
VPAQPRMNCVRRNWLELAFWKSGIYAAVDQ